MNHVADDSNLTHLFFLLHQKIQLVGMIHEKIEVYSLYSCLSTISSLRYLPFTLVLLNISCVL